MGYALAAEKVYLCTGIGEFIPTYDPLKNKFGCMARSLYLEHRLKVLVRFYFSEKKAGLAYVLCVMLLTNALNTKKCYKRLIVLS